MGAGCAVSRARPEAWEVRRVFRLQVSGSCEESKRCVRRKRLYPCKQAGKGSAPARNRRSSLVPWPSMGPAPEPSGRALGSVLGWPATVLAGLVGSALVGAAFVLALTVLRSDSPSERAEASDEVRAEPELAYSEAA